VVPPTVAVTAAPAAPSGTTPTGPEVATPTGPGTPRIRRFRDSFRQILPNLPRVAAAAPTGADTVRSTGPATVGPEITPSVGSSDQSVQATHTSPRGPRTFLPIPWPGRRQPHANSPV
jgi:hypothetical protein